MPLPAELDACLADYRPGAYPTLDLSAIGAAGPSTTHPAVRMDEVALKWMRYHFGDASRIVDPQLTGKVWRDEDATPILIKSLAEFDQEAANGRPAVLIEMADQMPDTTRSIDHRRVGGCGTGNGVYAYGQLWVGSHTFHCVGGREGEAKSLAFEVYKDLLGFSRVVGPALCLVRLEVMGVGRRRKLEEFQETWAYPVGLRYAYWQSWVLEQPDAVALGKVRTSTGSP